MIIDWNDIVFKNKKELKEFKPIFILGPRKISNKRFIQILKENIKGNLMLGILKDEFINGFEDQDHFKTLQLSDIKSELKKIENSPLKKKFKILTYFQREIPEIIEKLDFEKILLINGSWSKMFHTRAEFYEITKKRIKFKYISPFVDEEEAKAFKVSKEAKIQRKKYTDVELIEIANKVSKNSFATDFQTGCVLTKNNKLLLSAHNRVVPYQTYAMHFGSVKEKNFSPPNDQNFYDTNHAEVELLIKALEKKIDLAGTSLFIELLPCPTCARMLSRTKIKEIVYKLDHSDGYAYELLTKAGKVVRRI